MLFVSKYYVAMERTFAGTAVQPESQVVSTKLPFYYEDVKQDFCSVTAALTSAPASRSQRGATWVWSNSNARTQTHTHTVTVRLMSKHYNCVELLRHEVREEFSASKAQYRAVGGREGGADVLSSHISVISIPCSAPQAQIRVLEINCWDCWLLIFFFCDVFYTTTKRLMFV